MIVTVVSIKVETLCYKRLMRWYRISLLELLATVVTGFARCHLYLCLILHRYAVICVAIAVCIICRF